MTPLPPSPDHRIRPCAATYRVNAKLHSGGGGGSAAAARAGYSIESTERVLSERCAHHF